MTKLYNLAHSKLCLLCLLTLISISAGCGSSYEYHYLLDKSDWRSDIDYLTRESERIHPNLFHSVSRVEYLAAAERLKADLERMTRAEIFVGIKKLVALAAQQEDGHSLVTMFQSSGFRLYPLRLFEFADGVYVIDALPPHYHAIGQRVVQIGGKDISHVNDIIDPLITRDNEYNVKWKRTLHYVVPEILQATGVIADAQQGDYLLQDENGNYSTLLVTPIDKEVYRDTLENTTGLPESVTPLAMTDLRTPFWMQSLPAENALYVKYNWVFAQTDAGLSIGQFSNQLFSAVATGNPRKIIVDVRHNGGGDATTYGPLLAVLGNPLINQPGKLYLITGRATFSAAANFVTEIDMLTHARFVGEPTGGSLNNYGDAWNFELPNSRFGISIPTIYWTYAPGDSRRAIMPDIPVDWSAADYFNQRDPVLQAALDD